MSRTAPRSDLFRGGVSTLAASLITAVVLLTVHFTVGVEYSETADLVLTAYLVGWPIYTALYVGWGIRSFSRLTPASLKRATDIDDEDERHPLIRLLGGNGATNTTISAAVVSVVITIAIAQDAAFRGQTIYIVLALLMVASSWVLMVFSFARSYLRLGADEQGRHIRFPFSEVARFTDYITLAVLLSTMAATVSAEITSRAAWRVVRTNVIIAFVFNSVIIAMMVSLLFGGLLG